MSSPWNFAEVILGAIDRSKSLAQQREQFAVQMEQHTEDRAMRERLAAQEHADAVAAREQARGFHAESEQNAQKRHDDAMGWVDPNEVMKEIKDPKLRQLYKAFVGGSARVPRDVLDKVQDNFNNLKIAEEQAAARVAVAQATAREQGYRNRMLDAVEKQQELHKGLVKWTAEAPMVDLSKPAIPTQTGTAAPGSAMASLIPSADIVTDTPFGRAPKPFAGLQTRNSEIQSYLTHLVQLQPLLGGILQGSGMTPYAQQTGEGEMKRLAGLIRSMDEGVIDKSAPSPVQGKTTQDFIWDQYKWLASALSVKDATTREKINMLAQEHFTKKKYETEGAFAGGKE